MILAHLGFQVCIPPAKALVKEKIGQIIERYGGKVEEISSRMAYTHIHSYFQAKWRFLAGIKCMNT